MVSHPSRISRGSNSQTTDPNRKLYIHVGNMILRKTMTLKFLLKLFQQTDKNWHPAKGGGTAASLKLAKEQVAKNTLKLTLARRLCRNHHILEIAWLVLV